MGSSSTADAASIPRFAGMRNRPIFSRKQRETASVPAQQYRYTVLFEPAEEGGYVVTCPALPGLVTEGNTLEEARAMAVDAIRGYLEVLTKDGQPIPVEHPTSPKEAPGEVIEVAIEEA